MTRARATNAVIGTLDGIADALTSADVETGDLYAVADALQATRNEVLSSALDRMAAEEGRHLVGAWPRDPGPSAA